MGIDINHSVSEEFSFEKEKAIARKHAQRFQWEMILIGVGQACVWLSLWPLVMYEIIPLWSAFIVASFCACLSYLPSHEAQHGNYSRGNPRRRWIDSFVGNFTLITLIYPYELLRVTHMKHHAYTNHEDKDPDFLTSNAKSAKEVILLALDGTSTDYAKYKDTFSNDAAFLKAFDKGVNVFLLYRAVLMLLVFLFPLQTLLLWWLPAKIGVIYTTLFISEGTDDRNKVYLKINEKSDFIPIIDELIGTYSFIDSKDNILWFYTTESAPNGKIVNLEIKNGSYVWNEVIAESENAIRSVNIINNSFVINYLKDTFSQISIFDLNGEFVTKLSLPKKGTVSGFGGDIDDQESYFAITNYTTPREIYKIDFNDYSFKLFWNEELDGYNSDDYVSSLQFYPSKDGTKIPIHISHKKDLVIDENTPLLIYGYGGFNISILPNFSKSQTAWKNQGGVYAVANLRGGSEYGDDWHEAGMLLNKQNVFDDFAYAAKFLHSKKIGSPKTTAIDGRSNGGLLVAATMLQNPDLFKVAIPQVGVLDMLRFNKFTIGWAWESDYGSSEKKDEFENLLAYSPLHNIKSDVCYPTTLITTASRDDRVVPSHSFKFAAKLQENQSCNNPILIRVEDRAGHGAGTPKDKRINQISEIYGYALNVINN